MRSTVAVGASAAWLPMFGAEGQDKKDKKQVQGQEATANTYTIKMSHVHNGPSEPRKIDIPDVEGYRVLKGDFHIHTLFSDGAVMPVDRVHEAVLNGLDVIAITDHIEYRPFFSGGGKWKLAGEQGSNHNMAYEIALPEAEKKKLLLVRGTEITKGQMPPGHFNALFATDINPIAAAVDDWRRMLQVAAEQGAFLLWNHPGWEAQIGNGAPLRFTDEHIDAWKNGWLHGVEIFNYDEYYPVVSDWCNKYDLALFANSDIHESELSLYGLHSLQRPITLVLAKERTLDSIKEAMFARRTVAWAADTLWGREPWMTALFKASVTVKTVSAGRLEITNKSSLPVTASIGGAQFRLTQNVARQFFCPDNVNKIQVTNWFTAMNCPLEVNI
ncbi:MAG: hypothetical protein LBR06_01510 [Bacteroidales bacterium]|nr:hypothetical protein [Bacteroidales bacterium]